MCGIIGYLGEKDAFPFLIGGLKRLEYRGYDSSGIALLNGQLDVYKKKGKVAELENFIWSQNHKGNIGIGHTRWATHGEPSDENAHPHNSMKGIFTIVHNGIIENYSSLKEDLIKQSYSFQSETDTEVLANLIEYFYEQDSEINAESAVQLALSKVVGAYGVAVLCKNENNKIIVARKGSPLVIGIGKGEVFPEIQRAERIIIVGCGTSWHAALIGEYLIEEYAQVPVEVEYASEFRYRKPVLGKNDLVILISQSGETADTLAALHLAKEKGATVIGICNVVGSTLARETEAGVYTHAGLEIGVASTKAFTAQVTVLTMFALNLPG